eukprot:scaffold3713_cov372-Prasinococcus_capsulatus_cf.AAC.29
MRLTLAWSTEISQAVGCPRCARPRKSTGPALRLSMRRITLCGVSGDARYPADNTKSSEPACTHGTGESSSKYGVEPPLQLTPSERSAERSSAARVEEAIGDHTRRASDRCSVRRSRVQLSPSAAERREHN